LEQCRALAAAEDAQGAGGSRRPGACRGAGRSQAHSMAANAWRRRGVGRTCGGGRWPEGGGAEKKTPAGVDRELEERVYFYAQ